MHRISNLDIGIIGLYLFICLAIGLSKIQKIKNIKEYALGKRNFPTAVLIATTFATLVGVPTTFGRVEKTYEMGLTFVIPTLMVPFALIIMSRVLAYGIEDFRGCITLGDIMEKLYGSLGRWVTNFTSFFITIAVTAISAKVVGFVFEHFMRVPQEYGTLLGMAIIVLYSTFGGIQGVAMTDVFQFMIFFIVFPLACSLGYHDVGGISGIISKLPDTHLTIPPENYAKFASLALYSVIPITGIPLVQRALMTQNQKELKKTFDIVALLLWPFITLVIMIGLITYIKNPSIEPNKALFYFMDMYLPIGVIGFMIAGILAIIMSTVDSFLNSSSVSCAHDIAKQINPSITGFQELLIARISTVIIALLALLVANQSNSIIEIFWFVDNFWDPLVSAPLILGMLKIRPGKEAYKYAATFSMIVIFTCRYFTGTFDTISLCFGSATCITTLILFAKLDKRLYKTQSSGMKS